MAFFFIYSLKSAVKILTSVIFLPVINCVMILGNMFIKITSELEVYYHLDHKSGNRHDHYLLLSLLP